MNNLSGWAMSQKLPVNGFKWVEDLSEYDEDSIKSYSKEINRGYSLEVNVKYPENLHNLHNDLLFLHQRIKIEKNENFAANLYDKKNILFT